MIVSWRQGGTILTPCYSHYSKGNGVPLQCIGPLQFSKPNGYQEGGGGVGILFQGKCKCFPIEY